MSRFILCHAFADELDRDREAICRTWLTELSQLLTVEDQAVFPSSSLLDRVPQILGAIAQYLREPGVHEISVSSALIQKAQELGLLRYTQDASVHQILREYDLLAGILERRLEQARAALAGPVAPEDLSEALARMHRALRVLVGTTVDTFVDRYVARIGEQHEELLSFNRMASHELRSPLSVMRLSADLLAQPDLPTGRRSRLIRLVADAAERALHVLESVSRIARMDHDGDVPVVQEVELDAVVQDVVRQLAEMAEANGVVMRIRGDSPKLRLDLARLELILLNLVSNAIKYRDASKPEPFVEIHCTSQELGRACDLSVCDNGIGIAAEAVEEVFVRYYRAHESRDRELGAHGMGLGLAIVAECCESLGTRVEVESEVGQGTCFRLRLRSADAGDEAA